MNADHRQQQSIVLKDGRRLGFAEWGPLDGHPVLLFVGGSSRLAYPAVALPNIRLITIDRPGLGLSDFQPQRKLLDLPEDVVQLLDALGLSQVAIVGISQGGPPALACAYKIPQRLVGVSAVSSLAPPDSPGMAQHLIGPAKTFARLANDFPFALQLQSALGAWMVRLNPQWTFQQVLNSLPAEDRAIFNANPELCAVFVKDLMETYRQGSRGSAQEGLLAYRPWGFRLEEIRAPVHLWHGENDQTVSIAMARILAQNIPNCQVTYIASEGHFLGLKYWAEITAQLLARFT